MDVVMKFFVGFSLASVLGAKVVVAQTIETKVNQALQSVMSLGNQDKFVSDGQAVAIDRLGIRVKPVAGWEVETKHHSISLVMVEPAAEKVEFNKAIYRRNITVANAHKSSVPTEKVVEELHGSLIEKFGSIGGVSQFQILDTKRFDYKDKEDGILVYTGFLMNNEFMMMQAHVLLNGEKNQVLATYTDLAERFNEGEDFQKAWQTLSTIEVTGEPRPLYMDYVPHAVFGFLLLLLVVALRRMSSSKTRLFYESEGNRIYEDDSDSDHDFISAHSGMWNLGMTQSEGSSLATSAPRKARTRVSEQSFVTEF
jgi:hypothetical protein